MGQDAPFTSTPMHVEPQWIDYNGHLNMAYYNVLFDRCVDQAFALLGLGPDYAARQGASFFTLEAHVTYLREIHSGDTVHATLRILDHDSRRIHCFQELYHSASGFLSATSESIILHVDMAAKRASPFPGDIHRRIARMYQTHAHLPRPAQVGHVIAIPRT